VSHIKRPGGLSNQHNSCHVLYVLIVETK